MREVKLTVEQTRELTLLKHKQRAAENTLEDALRALIQIKTEIELDFWDTVRTLAEAPIGSGVYLRVDFVAGVIHVTEDTLGKYAEEEVA